jgi:hypothetical protein
LRFKCVHIRSFQKWFSSVYEEDGAAMPSWLDDYGFHTEAPTAAQPAEVRREVISTLKIPMPLAGPAHAAVAARGCGGGVPQRCVPPSGACPKGCGCELGEGVFVRKGRLTVRMDCTIDIDVCQRSCPICLHTVPYDGQHDGIFNCS